jgi:glucose/arabinose dehydrogenase
MPRCFLPVMLLLVILCTVLAACMARPGELNPVPAPSTNEAGPPGTTSYPGTDGVPVTPAGPDLTNEDSPLAATFTGGTSATPISGTGPGIGLKLVAGGLIAPMTLTGVPDLSNRLFVVDQAGTLRIITPGERLLEEPFLDIRDRMVTLNPRYDERGLIGLAFHPDFEKNGRFYVYYSAPLRSGGPAGWDCTNRLSEFRVSANPDRADLAGERILLEVDKPSPNHNGGQIRFGPDGYLYLPLGDGGGADDTGTGHTPGIGNAQDQSRILGKVLRIDVDSRYPGKEYGIPPDNPFVTDRGTPPEIYASGFRNPAYASFDPVSRRYIVASAGQQLFESVFIVLKGGNYGWNVREGTHCFDPSHASEPGQGTCPATGARGEPLIGPVFEGGHDLGNTIVGGYLYRGKDNPAFIGKYIFGYWSTSFSAGNGALFLATPPEGWDLGRYPSSVTELTPYDNRMWTASRFTIANTPNGNVNAFVRGFGEDNQHEIYVMVSGNGGPDPGSATGMVLKMVPASTIPVGKMGY